jgi:hypothetical protein
MARIVDGRLSSSTAPELTPAQRRQALRRLERAAQRNPLRRVRLECHGWVRDASAVVGDRVWCEACADFARAVELAE